MADKPELALDEKLVPVRVVRGVVYHGPHVRPGVPGKVAGPREIAHIPAAEFKHLKALGRVVHLDDSADLAPPGTGPAVLTENGKAVTRSTIKEPG